MKIVLIGDSGHAKVIKDIILANGDHIVGILDDKYIDVFTENKIIKGPIMYLNELLKDKKVKVIIAIGNNKVRKEVVSRLNISKDRYITCLHPSALVSPSAVIENGTVVMPGAIINADVCVGMHSIINTNAVIEHDCLVEKFVHISPASVITGGVKIAEGVHLGASSSVIPLVKIECWTTVGAGAVVVKDLPANCTAVGTPAIPIKFHE
ncbi:acetyltransferase [Lysinibacillus parviboronicapiens]|uniref:Acetyltransferase EpsM n=1 Tax=Lysinibacillus parviboronicapiens TaxID=436516 RepID=A0ABV2PIK8_9BACI|nr:acetyltransferase [Lysinibacillus parviboronicapiens]